jgi:hypothetical protein
MHAPKKCADLSHEGEQKKQAKDSAMSSLNRWRSKPMDRSGRVVVEAAVHRFSNSWCSSVLSWNIDEWLD